MSGAALDRFAGAAASHAPHWLPLVRAVRAGVLGLHIPQRGTPGRFIDGLARDPRPAVVLLGDDDLVPTGPAGWRCATRLPRWAVGAIVHGAGAEARHYEFAAASGLLLRRLVLVETDSAHQGAWERLFEGHAPVLSIQTRDGLPHPKPPAAREVN